MDGAVTVVDITQGVGVQIETLLHQTLAERVKPVLALNKLDCALLDPKISKEELYQTVLCTIDNFNVLISTYSDAALGDFHVSPNRGSVVFMSALQGWGFTLRQFASKYSQKFGIHRDKMMKRLWGNNFFDLKRKTWTTQSIDAEGANLERSFNMFVLTPILKVFEVVVGSGSTRQGIDSIVEKMNIVLTQAERNMNGQQLLKAILQKFLPASDALLDMVVIHLPSPIAAQRYSVSTLYEGSMEDEYGVGIRDCDPAAPLMLNVVRMLPTSQTGRFYALGRVFSGTVRSGEKIRIQGPEYMPGGKHDLYIKAIQGVFLIVGSEVEPIEDCPAGNIVAISGIDQFLSKSGTITTSETAHNMRAFRFSVPQFLQVAVGVKNPKDLPRLIEGLKIMSKTDSIAEISTSEVGDLLISAASEDHLVALVRDLTNNLASISLTISNPIIRYRESISAESSLVALAKSPNKRSRIYAKAMPLGEELTKAIEDGRVGSWDDCKVRAQLLAEEYGWDLYDARRIWTFGSDTTGSNLLVDCTKAVQFMHEIKDWCGAAFRWATKEGIFAEEPTRGVRLNIMDCTSNAESSRRGGGQIIPTMRRVTYAACLLAQPVLQEPVLLVQIECPEAVLDDVVTCLSTRRGEVHGQQLRAGTSVYKIEAYVPVKESFGLRSALRTAAGGDVIIQTEFAHWIVLPGSPLEKGSEVEDIVTKIRIRKGLHPAIPELDRFFDRL
ncbi:hypothetical protein K438DRAFT_1907099 [Mycena galopus ATCC 62051]|nr:hypothetical protein K438DRAFT_1907099 [Mycena galopus ATCC 62051]